MIDNKKATTTGISRFFIGFVIFSLAASRSLCVLLTLAISTVGVQILFSAPGGQIIYSNSALVVICSYALMTAEFLLLRTTVEHCIPKGAWRWRRYMLYVLTGVVVLAVIGLPAAILMTAGDVAGWDASLAVSACTVMLLYCDNSVNPSKAKDENADNKKTVTIA